MSENEKSNKGIFKAIIIPVAVSIIATASSAYVGFRIIENKIPSMELEVKEFKKEITMIERDVAIYKVDVYLLKQAVQEVKGDVKELRGDTKEILRYLRK